MEKGPAVASRAIGVLRDYLFDPPPGGGGLKAAIDQKSIVAEALKVRGMPCTRYPPSDEAQ